ncbi:MAG TPA: thioredoxin domain-containing protein [Crinalium sp.]|jgi:thioredoxin 1
MILNVDEKTFTKEVLGSSIPVLINFWAPWCSLCRIVQPLLIDIQKDWGDQIKLVNINADENFKLANTYRLTSLPTVLVVKDGDTRYRLDEFRNRDDLRAASSVIQATLEDMVVAYRYTA